MNKIEKYLESVYNHFDCKDEELQELKNEMRVHILDSVKELKDQGYTEDESTNIAIENFGDSKELDTEISDVFEYKNKDYRFMLKAIIIFMLFLTIYTKFFSKDTYIVYTRAIFPLILIPLYITYKGITIWNYNKRSIEINIKFEYLKIITTFYIILSINHLIFPLNFTSSYMNMPFLFIMPDNSSYALLHSISIMIAFIPFGLLMKCNTKYKKSLKRILLYSIGIFVVYCGIKFMYSLLGSENMAIRFFEIIGVIIGTSIGCLFHKTITNSR